MYIFFQSSTKLILLLFYYYYSYVILDYCPQLAILYFLQLNTFDT